jgi:O-antigen/teichoic acid export membrane protein
MIKQINRQHISNINWLFFDVLVRMTFNLVILILISRYLGPEKFGTYSYVLSIASIASVVANCGLQNIVVTDIARNETNADIIVKHAIYITGATSLICFALLIAFLFFVDGSKSDHFEIGIVVGLLIFFRPTEVISYYFEALIKMKFTVISRIISNYTANVIRIILIYIEAELLFFGIVLLIEGLIFSLALIHFYFFRTAPKKEISFRLQTAWKLFKRALPLSLSTIVIILNMRIDQVMVGNLLNKHELGIFSAAVRSSEIWFFMIGIFITTFYPTILKIKENDIRAESAAWSNLYSVMIIFSIITSYVICIFSSDIVFILYGKEYERAGEVISIYVWSGVLIATTSVWQKWIISKDKFYIDTISHCIAVVSNVLFNLYLIPNYGILGAAYATLLSGTISSIAGFMCYKPLTTINYILNINLLKKITK